MSVHKNDALHEDNTFISLHTEIKCKTKHEKYNTPAYIYQHVLLQDSIKHYNCVYTCHTYIAPLLS